jgi:hypothetical protein
MNRVRKSSLAGFFLAVGLHSFAGAANQSINETIVGEITDVISNVRQLRVQREDAPIFMDFTLDKRTLVLDHGSTVPFESLKAGERVRVRYRTNTRVLSVTIYPPPAHADTPPAR